MKRSELILSSYDHYDHNYPGDAGTTYELQGGGVTRAVVKTVMLLGIMLGVIGGIGSVTSLWAEEECLSCHGDSTIEAETERGKSLDLYRGDDAFSTSIHADLTCTDCHRSKSSAAFEDVPHDVAKMTIDCAGCHEDAARTYMSRDVHGQAREAGNPRAPTCFTCHGSHAIQPMSSPDSKVSLQHQVETCGACHGQEKLNREANITKRNLISRYQSSVHAKALAEGKRGAICSDCHGHHTILSSSDPGSSVGRSSILSVCVGCHADRVKDYTTGPHGHSLLHGNNDVPNCITCHGDHDMASLRGREGDAKQWASTQVCIWCHDNEKMMARYGLDTIPVQSYMADFHGLTQRGSFGASATCADCHDPHYSLPANHPESRMYLSNRGATCGKCHGKVLENFAQSFTHRKAMEKPGSWFDTLVRRVYLVLILLSVGGMIGFAFIIWLASVRKKFRTQRKERHVNRLNRFERVSHMILIVSFSTLAFTGYALKYPDAFWVKWFFSIGMSEAVRAFIHRTSAILMTLNLVAFGVYLLLWRRGRCILIALIPVKRDFSDVVSTIRYHLNPFREKSSPPRQAIFSYGEKFEFWALIWGTGIMLTTGVILWFPKSLPADFPNWIITIARTIHFYEAVLATLAILCWHMFFVMYHPDEYPMNTSWITGYITESEALHRFDEAALEKLQSRERPALHVQSDPHAELRDVESANRPAESGDEPSDQSLQVDQEPSEDDTPGEDENR